MALTEQRQGKSFLDNNNCPLAAPLSRIDSSYLVSNGKMFHYDRIELAYDLMLVEWSHWCQVPI